MVQLIVAVGAEHAQELEADLEEKTVGRWRAVLLLIPLTDDKVSNNSDIELLCSTHVGVPILVSANLTSAMLENEQPMIRRMSKDQTNLQVKNWLKQSNLSWRENAEACSKKGSFEWMEWGQWRKQFERVDPVKGPRVAAAILAQLKVASLQEMSTWFDGLEKVDHSVYYIGSDPHSGDHTLVNILAHRIDGKAVSDVQALPALPPDAKVRYFGDATWSGGEADRRIVCMFTKCDHKPHALGLESTLYIHMAYMTDIGEEFLRERIAQLHDEKKCDRKRVRISVPNGNLLRVDPTGTMKGLAFQDRNILNYVAPEDHDTMRALCKRIGKKVGNDNRPLGTADIASTIAFEHSLPRAMLPVLISGNRPVKASDGESFIWKPLMASKHVSKPAPSDLETYCAECPLQPEKKTVESEAPPTSAALLPLPPIELPKES